MVDRSDTVVQCSDNPRCPHQLRLGLLPAAVAALLALGWPERAAGQYTVFFVPTFNADITSITSGPDGALWFVEQLGNNIGRIATDGTISEFPLPSSCPNLINPNVHGGLTDITAGPNGGLWFTEKLNGKIGRKIPTGNVIAEFTPPFWQRALRYHGGVRRGAVVH